jgi:hypothetical protein
LIAEQALKRLGAIAGLDSIGQPLPGECSATVVDLLKECLASAMDTSRNQVNTDQLLRLIIQRLRGHRVMPLVLLVRDDLWSGEASNDFLFGAAHRNGLAVISTARLDPPEFETMVLHEVAHLFGAPSGHRKDTEQSYGGLHCGSFPKYACSLTQVDVGERPTVGVLTRSRLKQQRDFCPTCEEDLRALFSKQTD